MKPLHPFHQAALTATFLAMLFVALTVIAPRLIDWAPFLSSWREILSLSCLVHLGRLGWRAWTEP